MTLIKLYSCIALCVGKSWCVWTIPLKKERERERERIIVQDRMGKEQGLYLGAKVPDDFHIFSFPSNAWSSC